MKRGRKPTLTIEPAIPEMFFHVWFALEGNISDYILSNSQKATFTLIET